jgi:hypothetical protein
VHDDGSGTAALGAPEAEADAAQGPSVAAAVPPEAEEAAVSAGRAGVGDDDRRVGRSPA